MCICAASSAAAQYRLDPFTTSNGLPQNTVSAVLQSRDGYLWIATYDGLVRYDGVRFTLFDKDNTPALRSTQFLHLFEDSTGTIWAATAGGGVVRYRQGKVTVLGTADGLVSDYVQRIGGSPRGVLLFHLGGPPTLVSTGGVAGRATEAELREFAAPSRALWRHEPARLTRTLDGRTAVYDVSVPLVDFAQYRFEARDGSLWIGGRGHSRAWRCWASACPRSACGG